MSSARAVAGRIRKFVCLGAALHLAARSCPVEMAGYCKYYGVVSRIRHPQALSCVWQVREPGESDDERVREVFPYDKPRGVH